jgi:hypothetical protein
VDRSPCLQFISFHGGEEQRRTAVPQEKHLSPLYDVTERSSTGFRNVFQSNSLTGLVNSRHLNYTIGAVSGHDNNILLIFLNCIRGDVQHIAKHDAPSFYRSYARLIQRLNYGLDDRGTEFVSRWGPPRLLSNGCRRFCLREKSGRIVKVTTHLHLMPRLRTRGLYLYTLVCLHGVMRN